MMDIMDMSMNDFKACWHDSRNMLADDERNEIMFAYENRECIMMNNARMKT